MIVAALVKFIDIINPLRNLLISLLALQARYFGQKRIPVQVFPCKLNKENYKTITQAYNNPKLSKFWGSLRSLYDYFERTHTLPTMKIDVDGKYYFFANTTR